VIDVDPTQDLVEQVCALLDIPWSVRIGRFVAQGCGDLVLVTAEPAELRLVKDRDPLLSAHDRCA
jgi:hypothetical protein